MKKMLFLLFYLIPSLYSFADNEEILPIDLFIKDSITHDHFQIKQLDKTLYRLSWSPEGQNNDISGHAVFGYYSFCIASYLSNKNGNKGWVIKADEYALKKVSFYIATTNKYSDVKKYTNIDWPSSQNSGSALDANNNPGTQSLCASLIREKYHWWQ